MDNKGLINFTLTDVIERKIQFIKNETIFDRKYYEFYNEGSLLALREMLEDVKEMYEDEFLDKYFSILTKINNQYKGGELIDEKTTNKIAGYTNAILEVVTYINPEYPYTLGNHYFNI